MNSKTHLHNRTAHDLEPSSCASTDKHTAAPAPDHSPALHSAFDEGGSRTTHRGSRITRPESLVIPRRKPRGKIAELPKPQRDLINHLLDNGATYKTVRLEMAKHGLKLNLENISNWFNSGYQNHLRHNTWVRQIVAIRESSADLLQDYDAIKLNQAAIQLAVVQIFRTLKHETLADDPQGLTRLFHALARLSREAMVLAKYQQENEPLFPDDDDDPRPDSESPLHRLSSIVDSLAATRRSAAVVLSNPPPMDRAEIETPQQ